MPRKLRPQRSTSQRIYTLRELMEGATLSEYDEALGLIAGMRSSQTGFLDNPRMVVKRRELELVAWIHDVNRRKLAEDSKPIRTVPEYEHHRKGVPGAPAYKTLKQWLGAWPMPLAAAGLLSEPRPETTLTMPISKAKGQLAFDDDDLVATHARCINDLHGVVPTQRMFENWRDGMRAASTPGYNRIAEGDRKANDFAARTELALERIRQNPKLYAQAAPVWSRIPAGGYDPMQIGESR